MSAAPIHADNSAQAEYWNAGAGQRWTDHQEHQDQVLGRFPSGSSRSRRQSLAIA
jgi:hypothetical protein